MRKICFLFYQCDLRKFYSWNLACRKCRRGEANSRIARHGLHFLLHCQRQVSGKISSLPPFITYLLIQPPPPPPTPPTKPPSNTHSVTHVQYVAIEPVKVPWLRMHFPNLHSYYHKTCPLPFHAPPPSCPLPLMPPPPFPCMVRPYGPNFKILEASTGQWRLSSPLECVYTVYSIPSQDWFNFKLEPHTDGKTKNRRRLL